MSDLAPPNVLLSTPFSQHCDLLPHAYLTPMARATIRQKHTDFEVEETLSFEPSGEGEHLFLYIEKNNCNTDWVAKFLQQHFQLRSQDVGYAGKKDRYSLSRQWFSLHIPGKTEIDTQIENESFRVIKSIRHNKKLRKGSILHNHFKIRLTNISQPFSKNIFDQIKKSGFPNYFGYQRFGHHGNNLVKADKMLNGQIKIRSRNKRGIYLSAARSYLFNLILAERVRQKNWQQAVLGDCLILAGSKSYFLYDKTDAQIQRRLNSGDLHVSGWLAGSQLSETKQQAHEIEGDVLAEYASWIAGLDNARVNSARRVLSVIPKDLNFNQNDDSSGIIQFSLPAGCFATSLLRELFIINDAAVNNQNAIVEN